MSRRLILEHDQPLSGLKDQTPVKYKLFETDERNVEIYIDGIQGMRLVGPVVKLNCFTRGAAMPASPGGTEEREVACRLVMGVDTFFSIVEWLKNISADVQKNVVVEVKDPA